MEEEDKWVGSRFAACMWIHKKPCFVMDKKTRNSTRGEDFSIMEG